MTKHFFVERNCKEKYSVKFKVIKMSRDHWGNGWAQI